MLLRFPVERVLRHGARTSLVSKPNKSGSAAAPRCVSASEKIMNFSDGICPRNLQLLTADGPTPARTATSEVPPSVSTISSTVLSMTDEYSRSVNMSSVHDLEIFTDCELRPNGRVSRAQKDIAYRLELTREAIGIGPVDIYEDTGIGTNQWSQFVDPNGVRRITLEAAYKLKDRYGLTFEWIYDADRNRLPSDLLSKIKQIEKRGGVDLTRKRGRKRAAPTT